MTDGVQQTIPQHNYRLDAAALESKRFGEVSCREYREAVLHQLPHSWSRLSDTRLREAFFAKHRQARKAALPAQDSAKKAGEAAKKGPKGKAQLRAEMAEEMAKEANALVAHTQEGMVIVNLFNGAAPSFMRSTHTTL